MAKQIVNIGTSPNDKTGDPLRTAFSKINDNFTELYPIPEDVTYTVAADGDPAGVDDFDSLDLALTFLDSPSITTASKITFELNDGVHLMESAYSFSNKRFELKSASSNKSLCTVSRTAGSSATEFIRMIDCVVNCYSITFDCTVGGGADKSFSSILSCHSTNIEVASCDFKSSNFPIQLLKNSYAYVYTSTIDNCFYGISAQFDSVCELVGTVTINACNYGIHAEATGKVFASYFAGLNANITVSNCTWVGINAVHGGQVSLVSTIPPTLTGNTLDTNIPLNEIQYNGGYISDGTGPLSFKP